jgi:hypothetical protein
MSRTIKRLLQRAVCGALALAMAAGPVAYGDPPCEGYCQHWHCPCPFYHCMERPPKIKYKCGCPRPVCPPCALEHWGYFETCWRAWPFPPDWTHCPVPPAAAQVEAQQFGEPMLVQPPAMPGVENVEPPISPEQQLPTPRRVPSGL